MPETLQRLALIRGIDKPAHRVRSIVSTGAIDRYGEIILPSAFAASIQTYLDNPVLLWGHKSYGGPDVAIGKAVDAKITSQGLEAEFEYAVDANPTARMVWDLVEAGVVRAFSIGALAQAWIDKWTEKPDLTTLPDFARQAFLDGSARRVYTQVEWVETSQVLVPANRDALIAAMLSDTVDRDFALRSLGELELARSERTGAGSWPGWESPTPQKEAAQVTNEVHSLEELQKSVSALQDSLADTVRAIVQEELAAAAETEQVQRELETLIANDPEAVLAALEPADE